MFWNSADTDIGTFEDRNDYRGPDPDVEVRHAIYQANLALAHTNYRELWDLAHREYLRRQEEGQSPVLCEIVGELVARHALLTMLRDDWGYNARYWKQVTDALPPSCDVYGKRDSQLIFAKEGNTHNNAARKQGANHD